MSEQTPSDKQHAHDDDQDDDQKKGLMLSTPINAKLNELTNSEGEELIKSTLTDKTLKIHKHKHDPDQLCTNHEIIPEMLHQQRWTMEKQDSLKACTTTTTTYMNVTTSIMTKSICIVIIFRGLSKDDDDEDFNCI